MNMLSDLTLQTFQFLWKLFESKGWLCQHALHMLIGNISIIGIPSSYSLKRWTKGAKQGL